MTQTPNFYQVIRGCRNDIYASETSYRIRCEVVPEQLTAMRMLLEEILQEHERELWNIR